MAKRAPEPRVVEPSRSSSQGIVERKSTLPIFSHVVLEASKGSQFHVSVSPTTRAQGTIRFELPEERLLPEHPGRVLDRVVGTLDLPHSLAGQRLAWAWAAVNALSGHDRGDRRPPDRPCRGLRPKASFHLERGLRAAQTERPSSGTTRRVERAVRHKCSREPSRLQKAISRGVALERGLQGAAGSSMAPTTVRPRLLALFNAVSEILNPDPLGRRGQVWRPSAVLDLFQRFAGMRSELKASDPLLFGDLPERPVPTPTAGPDFDGEGSIPRTALEALERDIRYCLVVLDNISPPAPVYGSGQAQSGAAILVFVSHSSRDEPLARSLVSLLQRALHLRSEEIRCTSATAMQLPVGASAEERLRAEVTKAPVVIGLMTEASTDSAWVLFELGAGWGASRFIAPLLGGGAPASILPGPLRDKHAARCDDTRTIELFMGQLGERLGRTAEPPAAYSEELARLAEASRALGAADREARPPATQSPHTLTPANISEFLTGRMEAPTLYSGAKRLVASFYVATKQRLPVKVEVVRWSAGLFLESRELHTRIYEERTIELASTGDTDVGQGAVDVDSAPPLDQPVRVGGNVFCVLRVEGQIHEVKFNFGLRQQLCDVK